MDSFQLNLKETDGMIKKAKNLKRKFRSILINKLNPDVKQILSAHNVRVLQLSECQVDLSDLVILLQSISKFLETLDFKFVKVSESKNKEEISKVRLNKLKILTIDRCSSSLLQAFDTNSLETFKINILSGECECIVDILETQHELKQFSISGTSCENFFKSPQIFDFKFRLQSLSTAYSVKYDMLKFLNIHKESLKSLAVPILNASNELVLKDFNVFTHLTHLEISNLNLNEMTITSLKELPVCFKILHLKLIGMAEGTRKNEKLQAIMKIFPSLKHLDLSLLTSDENLMKHVAQNYRSLESLKISSFSVNIDEALYFPKLKEFEVLKIQDEKAYNVFLNRHSDTLEKIVIGRTDELFIKGLIVEAIMACHELKNVIIGSYSSPLATRMFNKVSSKRKPWILESHIEVSKNHHIALKFRFPDDQAIWQDRCSVHSDELIRELGTHSNYGLNAFINKYK